MKTLSVRNPYAWLIVAGLKPIENRTWAVEHRGPLLIHAAKKPAQRSIGEIEAQYRVTIDQDELQFGGIIGVVDLVSIVRHSNSIWFDGPFGWVLANARRLPFVPCIGSQGLFNGPLI